MKNVKNLSLLFILTLLTVSAYAQGGRDLTGTLLMLMLSELKEITILL